VHKIGGILLLSQTPLTFGKIHSKKESE